jgi:molybdopterin-biosynthesis enzyme MoeA-like protein
VVFSFGGIGVTPDDHTRQAVAEALGVKCVLHPEAEALIRGRFGAETTPNRLKLGEFPEGARIIENPFNRIPGFAYGRHYFLPGFPEMAWPMMDQVLDSEYAAQQHGTLEVEASMRVIDGQESQLLDLMEAVEARWPGVKVFSLPSFGGKDGQRRHIELGAKGAPEPVKEAMAWMRESLIQRGLEIEGESPWA